MYIYIVHKILHTYVIRSLVRCVCVYAMYASRRM